MKLQLEISYSPRKNTIDKIKHLHDKNFNLEMRQFFPEDDKEYNDGIMNNEIVDENIQNSLLDKWDKIPESDSYNGKHNVDQDGGQRDHVFQKKEVIEQKKIPESDPYNGGDLKKHDGVQDDHAFEKEETQLEGEKIGCQKKLRW